MRVVLIPEEDAPAEDVEGFSADQAMYAALGKRALQFTGARQAVVLGGGGTVDLEAKLNQHVTFHVWPLSRSLPDGSAQACQMQRSQPNVVFKELHNE